MYLFMMSVFLSSVVGGVSPTTCGSATRITGRNPRSLRRPDTTFTSITSHTAVLGHIYAMRILPYRSYSGFGICLVGCASTRNIGVTRLPQPHLETADYTVGESSICEIHHIGMERTVIPIEYGLIMPTPQSRAQICCQHEMPFLMRRVMLLAVVAYRVMTPRAFSFILVRLVKKQRMIGMLLMTRHIEWPNPYQARAVSTDKKQSGRKSYLIRFYAP